MVLPVIPIGLGLAALMGGAQAVGGARRRRREAAEQEVTAQTDQNMALALLGGGQMADDGYGPPTPPAEGVLPQTALDVIFNAPGGTRYELAQQALEAQAQSAEAARQAVLEERAQAVSELEATTKFEELLLKQQQFNWEMDEAARERTAAEQPTELELAMEGGSASATEAILRESPTAKQIPFRNQKTGKWSVQPVPGGKELNDIVTATQNLVQAHEATTEMRGLLRSPLARTKNQNLINTKEFEALRRTAQLIVKSPEMFNLGQVSGPDLNLLNALTSDDVGGFLNYIRDNPYAVDAQLSQLQRLVEEKLITFSNRADEWQGVPQDLFGRIDRTLGKSAQFDTELAQAQQEEVERFQRWDSMSTLEQVAAYAAYKSGMLEENPFPGFRHAGPGSIIYGAGSALGAAVGVAGATRALRGRNAAR